MLDSAANQDVQSDIRMALTGSYRNVHPGAKLYLNGSITELTFQGVLPDRGQNNEFFCLCTYIDNAGVLRNITVCGDLLSQNR